MSLVFPSSGNVIDNSSVANINVNLFLLSCSDSESFHTARSTTHTDTDGDKESSGEIRDNEVQEKEAGEKVKVKGDHPKNPSIKPNEVIGEGLLGTKPKVRQQQPTVPEKDSPSSQNECGLMTFGISSQPDKISAQLNEPSANETNTNVPAGHSSESQVCSTDVKSEEESQAAVKTEKLEDITAEFHPTKSNTQGSAEISSPPTQSGDNMGPNETGKGENKNYSGTSSTKKKKKKDRKLKKDKTIAAENEEKVRSMQLPGEPSDAKDEKADCDHLTECESIPESHIQGIKEDFPSQGNDLSHPYESVQVQLCWRNCQFQAPKCSLCNKWLNHDRRKRFVNHVAFD